MRAASSRRTLLSVTALGVLFGVPFAGCGGGDDIDLTTGAGSGGSTGTEMPTGGTGGVGGMGGGMGGSTGGMGGNTGGMGGAGGMGGSVGGAGGMGGSAGGAGGMGGAGGSGGQSGCVLDGVLTPPEECDDGNAVNGDGCDSDCTYSCSDPAADCPAAPICQQAICAVNHTCATQPNPAQEGTDCGMGGLCKQGVCAAPVCGDGLVEGAEQCDFGAGNGPNTGCETTCMFSCGKMPDTCPDANTCNGVEVCSTVVVNGGTGQACLAGQQAPDCSACAGGLCKSGACNASMCGDGCVDAGMGEQCEPPGSATCDAMCKNVAAVTCGNGVREAQEQCDDGNTQNLDGCDAACAFEQDHRSNKLTLQFATDAYCTANKFGGAIAPIAGGIVQGNIDNGVAAGTSGVLFKFMGLDTLTGNADDLMLMLGAITATPVMGVGYNGASDLDWWYTPNPASIDAMRTPLDKIPGTITGGVLNAGPGAMTLAIALFSTQPALFRLSGVKLQIALGLSNAPLTSPGSPPGHVAAENLDPALTSFASMGTVMAGKLCSNISAQSLAQAPIPADLLPGGQFACSQNYTAANTMLDLLVTGCSIAFVGPVVTASQPDQADPAMPPAGAGGPYVLQANAAKSVTTCRDVNNAVVNLSACLSAAAYSSYFQLTTDRVIIK